ncbi:hypothetical protein BC829DRAFT_276232 [Chytridium lagenaria]|nr:hypothetical protein BC829DRAFT_276232 [Chytridium lagenaria]
MVFGRSRYSKGGRINVYNILLLAIVVYLIALFTTPSRSRQNDDALDYEPELSDGNSAFANPVDQTSAKDAPRRIDDLFNDEPLADVPINPFEINVAVPEQLTEDDDDGEEEEEEEDNEEDPNSGHEIGKMIADGQVLSQIDIKRVASPPETPSTQISKPKKNETEKIIDSELSEKKRIESAVAESKKKFKAELSDNGEVDVSKPIAVSAETVARNNHEALVKSGLSLDAAGLPDKASKPVQESQLKEEISVILGQPPSLNITNAPSKQEEFKQVDANINPPIPPADMDNIDDDDEEDDEAPLRSTYNGTEVALNGLDTDIDSPDNTVVIDKDSSLGKVNEAALPSPINVGQNAFKDVPLKDSSARKDSFTSSEIESLNKPAALSSSDKEASNKLSALSSLDKNVVNKLLDDKENEKKAPALSFDKEKLNKNPSLSFSDKDNFNKPSALSPFDKENSNQPPSRSSFDKENSSQPPSLSSFEKENSGEPPSLSSFGKENSNTPPSLSSFDKESSHRPPVLVPGGKDIPNKIPSSFDNVILNISFDAKLDQKDPSKILNDEPLKKKDDPLEDGTPATPANANNNASPAFSHSKNGSFKDAAGKSADQNMPQKNNNSEGHDPAAKHLEIKSDDDNVDEERDMEGDAKAPILDREAGKQVVAQKKFVGKDPMGKEGGGYSEI